MNFEVQPQYLDTRAAARFLNLSPSTMAKLRCHGGGAEYRVLGRRKIVYRPEDLIAWAEASARRSTSEVR